MPPGATSDSTPPGIVPDGRGGAFLAWIDDTDIVHLAHLDPDGVHLGQTTVDDGRPQDPVTDRDELHLESLGNGGLALAYVTEVNSTTFSERQTYVHASVFDGLTKTSQLEFDAGTPDYGTAPRIDLAADGRVVWLVRDQTANNVAEPDALQLYVFEDDNRRSALENAFANSSPPDLRRPRIAARNGNVVIVGVLDNGFSASVFDPADGVWVHGETVAEFSNAASVPDSHDVVIRATTPEATATLAAVAFDDTTDRRLHLSERLPNTNWSDRPIGPTVNHQTGQFGEAFVRLKTGVDSGDFHLLWSPARGDFAGRARYDRFTDPNNQPVDPDTFLTPESLPLDGTALGAAVDQVGMPYAATSGPVAFLPAAARDLDDDGMPLFFELALCRDPAVPESGNPLETVFERQAGLQRTTLSFPRPRGPAVVDDGETRAGAFIYSLEGSTTLESFLELNDIPGVSTVTPLPTEPSSITGAVKQRLEVEDDPAFLPRRFFRLRVRLREAP